MPVVKRCVTVIEAHQAVQILQGQDIPATVGNEHTVLADPLLSNAVGGVTVSVPPEHVQRSLLLLNQDRATQVRNVRKQTRSLNRALWIGAFVFAIGLVVNVLANRAGLHDAFVMIMLSAIPAVVVTLICAIAMKD